ncbi:hypothetical protein [Qipengyuania sp.]|uniref:hypothetical protein n=1 Tax=Qipengyuania sp. TaxID=2004515 RepID=UPI003AF87076
MIEPGEIRFPSRDRLSVGKWRPIFFRPHPDSPEQFIIGLVAWNGEAAVTLPANATRKLKCLFGESSETVLLAQKAAITSVRDHLNLAGVQSLEEIKFGFSGICLGDERVGEAKDARALATYWLNRISSLHVNTPEVDTVEGDDEPTDGFGARISNDRLPVLVYHAIEKDEPNLADFFSSEIRYRAKRAPKPPPQKIFIGFAGDGLVANFATLRPSRSRVMVDHVKRLMWDLARYRDNEQGLLPSERKFEMVVYRRPVDDPELTLAQDDQLQEMIFDLGEQGAKEDIGVQSRDSVEGIAKFLQRSEMRTMVSRRA